MQRQFRTVLTMCAVSAALSACSDAPVSEPATPRVGRVNTDVLAACDFNRLKSAVREYVAAGNDQIYDTIRSMQQATTPADVYAFGMEGLARLALVRGSVAPVLKKSGATPAQGAAAVTGFLACMPVGEVQTGFATNIVKAMGAGGLFEVPVATTNAAVFSRGQAAGVPFWWAVPASGTWGGLIGKRVMLFGYEIENIDGNGDPRVGPGGFDYNTVPMLTSGQTFQNKLLIGVCGTGGTDVRLKHKTSILADQVIVCPANAAPIASRLEGGALDFASLARKGLGFLAPQPLHAATSLSVGSVGGAVSELSPAVAVGVTVNVSFTSQPVGGPITQVLKGSDGVSVKVLVETDAGTPLNNAIVTLEITGNSGLNALFSDPLVSGNTIKVTRPTNPSGIADFAGIKITKAGGYTLTTSAVFDNDVDGTPVISNLFNMQNK